MWNDLWTGDGTLYPPEVELAQHANHGQSESQSAGGVGVSIPFREVSTRMISVFVPGLSELSICGWIPTPACDPIVPGRRLLCI